MLFEDRGATLLCTAGRLPALRRLCITYDGEVPYLRAPVSETHGLPECKELAELRSHSLTELTIWMLGGPPDGNILRLSGLPKLRYCELIGDPAMPLNLRIDGASFQGTKHLESLRVQDDEGLQLQRGSVQHLSALKSLGLQRCGLRSVPADVASLGGTLLELDLSSNHDMQIDASAVDNILQCSRLETIYLYKPDISEWEDGLGPAWQPVQQQVAQKGYTPWQLSMDSVVELMRLKDTFHIRHGRYLHVSLDEI